LAPEILTLPSPLPRPAPGTVTSSRFPVVLRRRRTLRILQVTPYYDEAWAYGGIPRVVTSLSRGFASRDHHVTVCTTDVCDRASRVSRPRFTSSQSALDVLVFRNLSNRIAYDLQFFLPLGFGAYLRQHAQDFDIAHIHGCHHVPGVIAARHLRRAGVPYVISPHGTAPRIERRRLAKYVFDITVGRRVMAGAHRLIAVTDAERRQLVRLRAREESIAVIPNPVDLSEFEPPLEHGWLRARFGLGARPVVLFLGKLTPRKRLDVLVDAFARLGRPDATLVIAGNDLGAGRATLARVRRRGLERQTFFTGLLKGRQRLDVLNDADVVVYPGRNEIFGLVALEAILAGTPVIVADDSGSAEVIAGTGGGWVVPEGDDRALATTIGLALTNSLAARRAAATAREFVSKTYAVDRICGLVETLYADVLGAPTKA